MQNEGYNKISGRKTLILVIGLIVIIILLSIYSMYLVFRKSAVLTNSSSIEVPTQTPEPSPNSSSIPPEIQRFGD